MTLKNLITLASLIIVGINLKAPPYPFKVLNKMKSVRNKIATTKLKIFHGSIKN